ncbi:APC family permease [Halanaerobaculum tunisiense]
MSTDLLQEEAEQVERNQLGKVMSIFDYFTLGFGAMVGVGWVIVIGSWIDTAGGPLGAILAFLAAALMLIPIGLAYGELTSAMPVAGGEMAFSYKSFGTLPSFFTGWAMALAYTILSPWEAVAIGKLMGDLVPPLKSMPLYTVNGFTIYGPLLLISLLTSGLIITVNYFGLSKAAKFQSYLTRFLMVCALAFIATGLFTGDSANLKPLLTMKGQGFGGLAGIISVLAIAPFFFAGFGTIPQGAEEGEEGINYGSLGKVIAIAILAGGIFYILTITAVSMATPWQQLVDLEFPAADAFRIVLEYDLIANVVLISAIAGIITTFNSFFMAATRVLFALGRARLIPEVFAKVHPKHETPAVAIAFVGALTIIGPFIGSALILPLVNVGSLAFMTVWFSVCLAAVKLRDEAPDMNRPYKMFGGRTMALIGCFTSLIFTSVLVIPGSPGAIAWPSEWLLVGAWILLGAGFYWLANDNRKSISEIQREYLLFGSSKEENSTQEMVG